MRETIVIQSYPPGRLPWVERCMTSVARWSKAHGLHYMIIGDELFDIIPIAWREAAGAETLPRTDYARLLWMQRMHGRGYRRVLWVDADVLVLNPGFQLPGGDFLCREYWVYAPGDPDRMIARPAVNNCLMALEAGSGLLAWYLDKCARAPGALPLNRLALGPALLTRQHRITPFPLIETVPTLSPLLFDAVLNGHGHRIDAFRRLWNGPIDAVHLCRSLGGTADGPALVPPDAYGLLIDRLEQGVLRTGLAA